MHNPVRRYWYISIHGSVLKVKSDLKNGLLIWSIYTSGQMTCNSSTTLHDHMRHALQHSHGRTTNAYKGANHLATFEIRATLLRVNPNVVRRGTNVRDTHCTNLNRQVFPLNFEHVQKSDST